MSIDIQELHKVSKLAKLTLREEELNTFANNINKILGLVEKMNQVDTSQIKPMAHPLAHMTQRLREDAVTETVDSTTYQQGAPKTEAGLYLVPQVIDSQS